MQFLDCTIRDGGYYTQWDFDQKLIKTYLRTVDQLPIDYIELGYRSLPMPDYYGEYFYCPDHVFQLAQDFAPHKKFCIILNQKNTSPTDIQTLIGPIAEKIHMVRIAVAPAKVAEAIVLAKEIKTYGLKVCLNFMYLSTWENLDFLSSNSGQLEEYADFIYLVDSYGGCTPEQIRKTILEVQSLLSCSLGFHGHNNLELAMANTLAALDSGVEIVDATFMGMGRGAGNLKTELFLTYMASHLGFQFEINALSQLMDGLDELHQQYQWGTNLPYMMSGAYGMPQQDIMDWISTRRYSLSNIVQALGNRQLGIADNKTLAAYKFSGDKKCALIIGGGKSVIKHLSAIMDFVSKSMATIIHSSTRYVDQIDGSSDDIYCMTGNESARLESKIKNGLNNECVCVYPPAPRKMGTFLPRQGNKLCLEKLPQPHDLEDLDSPLALALSICLEANFEQVFLIGFEGYANEKNIDAGKMKVSQENQQILDHYQALIPGTITSLVPTNYRGLNVESLYSLL